MEIVDFGLKMIMMMVTIIVINDDNGVTCKDEVCDEIMREIDYETCPPPSWISQLNVKVIVVKTGVRTLSIDRTRLNSYVFDL